MLLSCLCSSAALAAPNATRPDLIPGRGLYIVETDAVGPVLAGLQATADGGPVPMEVIMCFDVPGYWTCVVENPDGEDISVAEEPIATGDRILLTDPEKQTETVTVVVRGDVLGTGELNIAQLTALARDLTGQGKLDGPYALAADLNGSGSPDIADLTLEARLLQTGGIPEVPADYPALTEVAQAAYFLNPRDGGDIYTADDHVRGPLAETVLYSLIDLRAKWQNPEAPTEGLLGDPDNFNPLLLDVLTSCEMEPIDSGRFEYRFDANRILTLLEALFGFDVSEDLREGIEKMEGDVFWEDDYIELSGEGIAGSVVNYIGLGAYPSPTDTYEFESRLTYYFDEEEEMTASMWYTIRIIPDGEAPFGFLVESCRFADAAG